MSDIRGLAHLVVDQCLTVGERIFFFADLVGRSPDGSGSGQSDTGQAGASYPPTRDPRPEGTPSWCQVADAVEAAFHHSEMGHGRTRVAHRVLPALCRQSETRRG